MSAVMTDSMVDDSAEIEALRAKYPLRAGVQMQTTQGRRWKRRMDDSETYFKRYSAKWEENRALLVDFDKMVEEFGTYVAVAYPIIKNFIADIYFRNPDPFIQDKGGNKLLGRILTDVIKAVHAQCDTESEIRACFLDQSYAGFGGVVGSFVQKPHNAGELVMEEADEPTPDADEAAPGMGSPMPGVSPPAPKPPTMRPATMLQHTGEFDPFGNAIMQRVPTGEIVEPTDQRVVIQRISPWRCRFDPKGRRWDMSDHRWWAYDSFEYLGDLMRDPLLSDDDKARLMAFYSHADGIGAAAFSPDGGYDIDSRSLSSGYVERDPDFIRVCLRTIWSRPDHMVYKMPYGASFTFTPRPWDEEWERVDKFPYRYMPRNRVPEDKLNTEGFIPLPDIQIIGQHIKNINKAQGLLVAGLGHVIDVYVTMKGVLDGATVDKATQVDRLFKVIQLDPSAYEKYPTEMREKMTPGDLFELIPTGDVKDMQHMAFIDHEFSMIAQEMGQGPADRGGVSTSKTATDSLGVQQGLQRRMSTDRADAGKQYNAVSEMIFIILQQRQTLPIPYQMTSSKWNQTVWTQFTDPHENLKNLQLHFDYATGSMEPQTREQQFALRERAGQILMPILQASQDNRNMMKLAQELIEPLGLLDMDGFFDDEASQIVMQLEAIVLGLGKGSVLADDPQASQQIMELLSKLFEVMLTPSQEAEVVAQVNGVAPPAQGQQNTGSIAAAPSPGEASAQAGAAGSAAAGASGGIAFTEQLPSTNAVPA